MTKEPGPATAEYQQRALTLAVLAHMREVVTTLTGKSSGPRDAKGNRDMIRRATKREGATLDDWKAVIDAQYESVRDSPSSWRYLCLSTITRPSNWARLADAPVAPKSTGGTTSKSGAFTPRGEYTDL